MSEVSSDRVTAAVLIIGDEILSGRTQDTNLRDIARYLGVHGVDLAEARGVALREHPDIIAMMSARWGGELNAARRRMARVPVGGELVKNPVQGPPGFTIGNVFVLAGVPQIMRGMLEDVGPRLRGGAVTVSRTVRVEGSGEGVIAAPLEAVAKAHPGMSLGSYPFFGAEGYGSNLVLRGRDPEELAGTVEELIAALRGAGVENVREVDAA